MLRRSPRNCAERGSALIEFVFCFGLIWLPLFTGLLVIGAYLIQELQVTQVCRDAAHMFAYGTDFSQPSSQALLASLAPSLNLKTDGSSGNSIVIISTIVYVDQSLCNAGNLQQGCPNLNMPVFTRQIVIGNSSIPHASVFGTPPVSADGSGNVSLSNSLTNSAAQAVNFSSIMPSMQSSMQPAFVAEVWFDSPVFNGLIPFSSSSISARFIF